MRSRYLSLKPFDDRSQVHIIPAKYGSPIPVWGQNDFPAHPLSTETFTTIKLRRFCLEYPANLTPALQPESGWLKQPRWAIAVLGMGTFLGLSIPLTYSPDSNGTVITAFGDRGSHPTQPAGLTANDLGLNRTQPLTRQPFTSIAFAGLAQTRSNWPFPGRSSTPQFVSPVEGYPMTSGFGDRVHPIFGDTRFHHGIDLGTPVGTPIRAAASGSVSYADWNGGYGKTIILRHSGSYETWYAHLEQVKVKVGDRVRSGQIIGLSGSTGYVTGPHLHFEIRRNDIAYNPLDYL
jgi:murein DD-endopeptidase MepM/ murein hydrolase activator NlpD